MTTTLEHATAAVREARETLASLITKRGQHDVSATVLAAERAEIAFKAHTGDKAAAKRLNEIHIAVAKQASEIASLDSAIEEANRRVADALNDLARAEAADNARQALALLPTLHEHGLKLDEACRELLDGYKNLNACYRSLQSLGVRSPSSELVENGSRRSVIAALMSSELALHRSPTAFLAPSERISFSERTEGWARTVETWANAQLEPEIETELSRG